MRYEETAYGFNWGAADVERAMSDAKKGWVALTVKTPRQDVQVYVTRTGLIRVFERKSGEWKPVKGKK